MKVKGDFFRAAFIIFAWLVSSGSLIKGYYYISFLSAFLGIWLIAMPEHYQKGRGRMAWMIVMLVSAIILIFLHWRGM